MFWHFDTHQRLEAHAASRGRCTDQSIQAGVNAQIMEVRHREGWMYCLVCRDRVHGIRTTKTGHAHTLETLLDAVGQEVRAFLTPFGGTDEA